MQLWRTTVPALFLACAASVCAHAEPSRNGGAHDFTRKRLPATQAELAGQRNIPAYSGTTRNARYDNENYALTVDIKGGLRKDELRWDIGSPPLVNILSELEWKDVEGYQVTPTITYVQKSGELKGLYLEGSIYASKTHDGRNRDSDYDGNNRTLEFSRSNNSADGGHAEGFSAGLGYAFDFADERKETVARFMVLFGYALQKQTFIMEDGNQTVSNCSINYGCVTPAVGPFSGLKSSYKTDWSLPFIGIGMEGRLTRTMRLKGHGRYYWGTYEGVGNWNLRTDFAHPRSFQQDADASGFNLGLEFGWMLYPNTEVTLSADYQRLTTDSGVDTIYFSNGTSSAGIFNEAVSTTQLYMAGLSYTF